MDQRIVQFRSTRQARSNKRMIKGTGDDMCTILRKLQGKTAMDLLRENKIDLTPPIDIATLLDKLGISAKKRDFSEVEKTINCEPGTILGAAYSNNDQLAIFYCDTSTYNRSIFTIAHELAHCCLHAENLEIDHIELRTSDSDLDEREREANIFAGELLIPTESLKPIYDKFIVPSLKTLSEIFCVSTNVMAARLDFLGWDYLKDINISEV